MELVAAILNIVLFLGFIIGLPWLSLGILVGVPVLIYKFLKKQSAGKGWYIFSFGGVVWLIAILVIWVILNVIMTVTGNSQAQYTPALPFSN